MEERYSTDEGYEEQILDAETAAAEPSDVHPPLVQEIEVNMQKMTLFFDDSKDRDPFVKVEAYGEEHNGQPIKVILHVAPNYEERIVDLCPTDKPRP